MKYFNSSHARWKAGLFLFLVLLGIQALFFLPGAFASPLTSTEVRLDRLSAGQDSTWELEFTTASAGATSLSVDFTSSWTTNSGTINTSTQAVGNCVNSTGSNVPGLPATGTGTGSTISVSGFTALSATTAYCVAFTTANSVHTPTAGQYTPLVTVGSDTKTAAVDIVASGGDQVTVSATVNPSFTFTMSAASENLTLSTSGVSTSGLTAQVSTNAAAGWQVWARDAASSGPYGLKSTTAGGHTIQYSPAAGSTASTLTTGGSVEGYNLGTNSATGTCNGGAALDTHYDSGGTSLKGGGLDNTLRSLAIGGGTASACTLPLTFNAVSANTTPAATDYTDTVTFVGAGLF